MAAKHKKSTAEDKTDQNWDQQNLVAFFRLLLEVDKRFNPQKYEVKSND